MPVFLGYRRANRLQEVNWLGVSQAPLLLVLASFTPIVPWYCTYHDVLLVV